MGSMTIGAKYKTTVKDPGTPGVLRIVRTILPQCLPPLPFGSPPAVLVALLPLEGGSCGDVLRWRGIKLGVHQISCEGGEID
jgi:hypothetical protein